MLTVFAEVDVRWQAANEFTVRRDEVQPVVLSTNLALPDQNEVVQPGTGSVTFGDDNQLLYQPQPGFVGIDVFTITVTQTDFDLPQPTGDREPLDEIPTQNLRVSVNVVDPLLAVDDWYQVQSNSDDQSRLNVLENDTFNARYIGFSDRELTIQSVTSDGNGIVSIGEDALDLVYQPAADFQGVETLTYTAVDQDGYTTTGTTQVRVATDSDRESLWPEQLQQELVETAVSQNQSLFGRPTSFYQVRQLDFEIELTAVPGDPAVPAEDTSQTNNQIADVDESDRIKTDGDFLYVLSAPDQNEWNGWGIFPFIDFPLRAVDDDTFGENLLTIIDIQRPDTPIIVSRQILSDEVLSLDLHGDRLTVISQRDSQTVLTTLDVSDAPNPQTVSTTLVDGTFKQARRVGESLFIFTQDQRIETPQLGTVSDDSSEFEFYETGHQYLERVRDELIESAFASQQVFDANGDPVDVETFIVDPLETGIPIGQRLNIITLDTSRDIGGAIDWDIHTNLQYADPIILVTTESIYVTHTNFNSNVVFDNPIDVFDDIPTEPTLTTAIDRYQINNDGVSLSANGVVPGRLNNSFSLDEHDGLLRIATENSWFRANEDVVGSHVYVLQQSADELQTIGGVTGLAPGEQIYAVRFAGDRGYVVTFRQVDPLFVIDLTEPTAPEVLGELKAPGYSQYLHVISEDHVLGVGRDADPETGLYEGLTVSLFNVSDPAVPTLQDRYLFEGGRSTFSPFAENDPFDVRDHHAISYFADSGVLALPYYSRDSFGIAQDDVNNPIFESSEQSAVRTFTIDTENGISVLDTIAFDSRADRTVRIGQQLYSLSAEELKVTNLLQPDGVIAELDFEREGADDFVDAIVGQDVILDVTDNDGTELESTIEVLAASLLDGDGEVSVVGNNIQFKPSTGRLIPQRIRYTARNAEGTLIEAIATVDPDLQWQNLANPHDVNGDEIVSARDALNTINLINRHGATDTESIEAAIVDATGATVFQADTNGDQRITAADALEIINRLGIESTNATDPVSFDLGSSFAVAFDDIAIASSDTLQIQVTELHEDSRCPIDVQCITEGQVRIQVSVSDQDAPTSVELAFTPSETTPVQVAGYEIELVEVLPVLRAGQIVELEQYSFRFLVTDI